MRGAFVTASQDGRTIHHTPGRTLWLARWPHAIIAPVVPLRGQRHPKGSEAPREGVWVRPGVSRPPKRGLPAQHPHLWICPGHLSAS